MFNQFWYHKKIVLFSSLKILNCTYTSWSEYNNCTKSMLNEINIVLFRLCQKLILTKVLVLKITFYNYNETKMNDKNSIKYWFSSTTNM